MCEVVHFSSLYLLCLFHVASVFFSQHEEILLFVFCGLSVFSLFLTFVITPFDSRHVNSFVVALAAFVVAANFVALLYGNHISTRIADLLLDPVNFIAFFVAASVLAFMVGELVFYTMYYRDPTGDRRYHVPDLKIQLQNDKLVAWDSGRRDWKDKNSGPPAVVGDGGDGKGKGGGSTMPEIVELLPQRTPRVHQHRQFYSKEAEARERAFMKKERADARRLSRVQLNNHARVDSKEFKETQHFSRHNLHARKDSHSVEMVPHRHHRRRARAGSRDAPILSRITTRTPENFDVATRDDRLRRDPSLDFAVRGAAPRFEFGDADNRSPSPRSKRNVSGDPSYRHHERHSSSPVVSPRSNDSRYSRRNLDRNGASHHQRHASANPFVSPRSNESQISRRTAGSLEMGLDYGRSPRSNDSRRNLEMNGANHRRHHSKSPEHRPRAGSRPDLRSSSRNLRDASRRSKSPELRALRPDLRSSSRNLRDASRRSKSPELRGARPDLRSSSRNLRDVSRRSRKNLSGSLDKENDETVGTRNNGSVSRRSRGPFGQIPEDNPMHGSRRTIAEVTYLSRKDLMNSVSKRHLGEDSRRSRRKLRDIALEGGGGGALDSNSKLSSSSRHLRDESRRSRRKLGSNQSDLPSSRYDLQHSEGQASHTNLQHSERGVVRYSDSPKLSPELNKRDRSRQKRRRRRRHKRKEVKPAPVPVQAYYPGLDRHYVVTEEHLNHTAVTSGDRAAGEIGAIRLPRNGSNRRREMEPSSFYSMQRGQRAPPASQFLMRDLRRDRVIAV